jgi:hypothetical protein
LWEVRQKFITITINDDQNKAIGSLKINLYLLATGPYHQDFSIPLPKAPGARLSFNLKMAQLVKIRMRINDVKLVPKNKEFPGDTFAFALRSIVFDSLFRLATRLRIMDFRTSTLWVLKKIKNYEAVSAKLERKTSQWRQTAIFKQFS